MAGSGNAGAGSVPLRRPSSRTVLLASLPHQSLDPVTAWPPPPLWLGAPLPPSASSSPRLTPPLSSAAHLRPEPPPPPPSGAPYSPTPLRASSPPPCGCRRPSPLGASPPLREGAGGTPRGVSQVSRCGASSSNLCVLCVVLLSPLCTCCAMHATFSVICGFTHTFVTPGLAPFLIEIQVGDLLPPLMPQKSLAATILTNHCQRSYCSNIIS
jgi:hypothetical protein